MKETKLSSVIEVISMGPFGSDIKVDNFISEGIPVLNGSNLTSHKLVENSFKYVSLEKANKLGKANAFRGDIVITHRGTLGQVSYIPYNSKYERYVISQSQFRVRFNDDLDPVYFSYLMKSDYGQKKLLSFKSHVGVPALAQATSNFKRLELRLHSIIDQKKIAAVLSALDNKIELNNQINTELEAMAKTLYDYWFVQFDFPFDFGQGPFDSAQGKTNENGTVAERSRGYKSSGGKMVFNKTLKRDIPEGWKVKNLNYFNLYQSQTISEKEMDIKGKYFVFGANGIVGKYFKYNHEESEIVITCRGNSCGNIIKTLPKCWITGNAMVVGSDYDFMSKEFIYQMLSWVGLRNVITGSGQPQITRTNLETLLFILPDIKLIKYFSEKISSNSLKRNLLFEENQELAQLRDWLLPMLMNGQVRVGEGDGDLLDLVADERGEYRKI